MDHVGVVSKSKHCNNICRTSIIVGSKIYKLKLYLIIKKVRYIIFHFTYLIIKLSLILIMINVLIKYFDDIIDLFIFKKNYNESNMS